MRSVVVGTAGHIDHGKSALVQALTGTDPDRLKEEKARGITIDLGFAHLALGDLHLAFIDVPGHERFVKNMLAGVGGIDLVVLVVAADESVMPQTREHFDICRLLRVPSGVVALTKADLVDADTLGLVQLEVRDLIAGSFLEGAPLVAVSSRTGQGLDDLRRALRTVAQTVRGRPTGGAVRLPIDRVFSIKGFGTVVTGTLVSGRIRGDDELMVAPGGRRVKVRGVQVHGAGQAAAVAGQRAAVNVGGVEVHDIERGQNLVTPGTFECTRLADAVVEVLPGAKPLKHGVRARFHQGTTEILGRVALVGPVAQVGDTLRAVPALAPGARAYVRLRLEREAVLSRGDRYVLRAYSPAATVAGGVILDPRPPRTAIRSAAALERCHRLDFDPTMDADRVAAELRAARVMIDDAGLAGLPSSSLASRVAVEPDAVEARIATLVAGGDATRAGDVLVTPRSLETLKAAIAAMLGEHHRAQPLSDGIPREEARERLLGRGHAAVFERALEELSAAGMIVVRDRIALAGHRVALSPEEERARQAIERIVRDADLKPPAPASLAAAAGVPPMIVDRMVKLLLRQKVLVKIDTLVFHEEALGRLKAAVTSLKAGGSAPGIDVAAFKERFGVTRKFAIPLLEYLDRERVTRRVGDARIVL
jgi:selenocysteine-specific elongation factor